MRILRLLLLALPLTLAGCILVSGQIITDLQLGDLSVSSLLPYYKYDVNLNDNSDYQKHKDDLVSLADFAVLGKITNNNAAAVDVEIYMTHAITTYTDVPTIKANAIKVWGPFHLAASETKTIGWDESAALFSAAGKAALLQEAIGTTGDATFTLYAVGTTAAATYSFTIPDARLVLVLDGHP